jgi:transposase
MNMRPPAKIKDWLGPEEMLQWVKNTSCKAAFQRRISIWLTSMGRIHAHRVASMLGVSTPSVWLWIKLYNSHGPNGLEQKKKGGRNWAYLSIGREREILDDLIDQYQNRHIPNVFTIKKAVEHKLGRKVSTPYIYKLLKRHKWPYIYAQAKDTFAKYAQPWKRKI